MVMITKDEAIKKIKSLVERFEEQKESYKKTDYNETQTRQDFINPFWKALGWDVDNEIGCAEMYREVIQEDHVKVNGKTKLPDYSFRLSGGTKLFFLEAKKPSVNVNNDLSSAYQIRRYGWSAKMRISIISNFEQFAIYDCSVKPKEGDSASKARIRYFTYSDYLKNFDFFWDTFSKTAVLKASFDKFIQSDKNKKGTTTVDEDFVVSLDKWRVELATKIASGNKGINEEELNFVVQHIIDRIIFLRIIEDRNLEPYESLKEICKTGNYYENLLNLFKLADKKYNSGLFDFRKDTISSKIKIDNNVIKKIILELYYPYSPYEFSVISVEILGSAYEQFLGKKIFLSKSRTAHIEYKPEVRKAGGVYYTPQNIVDYIVKNTVGKLIENKTPQEVSKIKIVDPACGSGSFLIGAYQFLLNWHKEYYLQNDKQNKGDKDNPLTPTGELTVFEKKGILLNNIFGVDLDSNAVEVSKLSLLLKCLEGETKESIESHIKYLKNETVLPSLDNNVKCGNSLVDYDYFDVISSSDYDQKLILFSWKEAFPEIFAKGGFDCVIGNPPYVFTRDVDWSDDVKNYFWKKFDISKSNDSSRKNQSGKINLYILFILKSTEILKKNGLFSVIIPNGLLRTTTYDTARKFILDNTTIERIVDLKAGVFEGVTASTIILSLINNTDVTHTLIIDADYKKDGFIDETKTTTIQQSHFLNNVSYTFSLFVNDREQRLFNKLNSSNFYLKNIIVDIIEGIVAHKEFISTQPITKEYKPMLEGKDIKRFQTNFGGNYVLFDRDKIHRARPDYVWQAEKKIVIQRISGGKSPLVATIDKEKFYAFASTNLLLIKDEFVAKYSYNLICALLNSKLWNFYYSKLFSNSSNLTVNISKTFLEMLPLPIEVDTKKADEVSKNVDLLLKFNKELKTTNLPQQSEQLKQRIKYCEDKIDKTVYELYELSEEEVKIVEVN